MFEFLYRGSLIVRLNFLLPLPFPDEEAMNSGGKVLSSSQSPGRSFGTNLVKTPGNAVGKSGGKTPGGRNRTPAHTSGKSRRNLTPSRNPNASSINSRTPGGDRFIPNRSASCYDLSNYLINSRNDSQNSTTNSFSAPTSPTRLEYQRIMSESLNGGVTGPGNDPDDPNASSNFRVLAYQKGKTPVLGQGFANMNKVLYSAKATPASSCKKTLRHIPNQPDKILDAPEILDDYYLNLVDWSSSDLMGVALSRAVYLWASSTGEIQQLFELDSNTDLVTSLSFSAAGNYLAAGISDGTLQLWDVERSKKLRTLTGHSARVGATAWNSHVLSSGDGSGLIRNQDVRIGNSLLNELNSHTQQICGLKWSPDGKYLASGGNDNLLNIWPQVPNEFHSQTTPLHTFTDHQAAVKALAWCPWQPSLLASGGGTADRHIRLWNVNNGQSIKAIDTESQVCGLLWSAEHKELISGHGYPGHLLSIWKYPQMNKICDLVGHTARVLYMAMCPSGEYVVSAAADESLRIWHCFASDPKKKKAKQMEMEKNARSKTLTSLR